MSEGEQAGWWEGGGATPATPAGGIEREPWGGAAARRNLSRSAAGGRGCVDGWAREWLGVVWVRGRAGRRDRLETLVEGGGCVRGRVSEPYLGKIFLLSIDLLSIYILIVLDSLFLPLLLFLTF